MSLFPLVLPVMGIQLQGGLSEFQVSGRLHYLPGHQIFDSVGKSFLVEVVKDLGRISENGCEEVEFNITLGDLPVFLHLQMVDFLCCFSLQINSFKFFTKLLEKHRPIIEPLGFFIVIII